MSRCPHCGAMPGLVKWAVPEMECVYCSTESELTEEQQEIQHLKSLLEEALEYVRAEPIYRDATEGPNPRLDRIAAELAEKIRQAL